MPRRNHSNADLHGNGADPIGAVRRHSAPTPDAALPQERAAALGKALEAWESLRQNGSVAMYAPEGGSLSPLMASLWYLEQTARTARWLEGLTENLDQ